MLKSDYPDIDFRVTMNGFIREVSFYFARLTGMMDRRPASLDRKEDKFAAKPTRRRQGGGSFSHVVGWKNKAAKI